MDFISEVAQLANVAKPERYVAKSLSKDVPNAVALLYSGDVNEAKEISNLRMGVRNYKLPERSMLTKVHYESIRSIISGLLKRNDLERIIMVMPPEILQASGIKGKDCRDVVQEGFRSLSKAEACTEAIFSILMKGDIGIYLAPNHFLASSAIYKFAKNICLAPDNYIAKKMIPNLGNTVIVTYNAKGLNDITTFMPESIA